MSEVGDEHETEPPAEDPGGSAAFAPPGRLVVGARSSDREAKIIDAVDVEMLKKYQADWFATPERWRTRARLALTVSSSIAALIGFGTLIAGIGDDFESESNLTIGLIIASVSLWVLASLIALWALSWDVDPPDDGPVGGGEEDLESLLDFIPRWANNEGTKLEDRTHWSVIGIGLALVVTLLAVIASVTTESPNTEPELVAAEIVFTEDVETSLEEVCDLTFSAVAVRVKPRSQLDLTGETIDVVIVGCDGEDRLVTVRLEDVLALQFDAA